MADRYRESKMVACVLLCSRSEHRGPLGQYLKKTFARFYDGRFLKTRRPPDQRRSRGAYRCDPTTPYWKANSDNMPELVNDYRVGGYNHFMAERMLDESVEHLCQQRSTPCTMSMSSSFKVLELQRLENIEVFKN